ncbi:BING4CT-domain-containing protein [Agrocybe pediades]|nr:BING4CT-domain-containing protein [Agrocybe pediades]
MDSLIAKADAIQPLSKKRKSSHSTSGRSAGKARAASNSDFTLNTVVKHTSIPKSLQDSAPLPENGPSYKHIANKKLRTQLNRQSAQTARSQALVEDAEMLLLDEAGGLQVENDMDRTWRVGQTDILQSAGQEAAKGRREYKLDGGPYRSRYSRNGRHLAIAGRTGHVSTFDWQTGTVHAELQLQETCRDITFLQDHSFFAVAQKKYAFIYDRDGVEVHCLKGHIEPTRLEFLPYHWLLATVGNPGYLKYQDTSTGQLLVEHRTKMGACSTMTQNLHNAVIHLGHQNGCVTLWTPNLPHPAVQLLAHVGPVVSVAVDPSEGGRYMATSGRDGTVKVWDCRNWKGAVRDWTVRGGGDPELEWSARGYLAVASSGTVNIYNTPSIHTPFHVKTAPPLYMTHPIPHRPLTSVRFAPFQDILTVGHSNGLSSVIVPGSGEPNFDSREADPFENTKARREREVKALLDKIQPDLITLDPDMVGNLAPVSKLTTEVTTVNGKPRTDIPFARLPRIDRLRVSGKMDDTEENNEEEGEGGDEESKKHAKEEREKRKMRGKGKSMKRYLRKQRKNVIDPAAIAIRAKLERQKEEKRKAAAASAGNAEEKKPSALDRFTKTKQKH